MIIENNRMLPNYNDGRFFVSPILGCTGLCAYCYLELRDFRMPKKNLVELDELSIAAECCKDFKFGKQGTIISVGAWGDIFPRNNIELIEHSIEVIQRLLSWGNPVQIMSKNYLDKDYIQKIAKAVRFKGQLLYSTTITTVQNWKDIEANTSDPISRLETCFEFHKYGVPTNVLLKPFIDELTGIEFDEIGRLLLKHEIDFCTIGIMYWNDTIKNKVFRNPFLSKIMRDNYFDNSNHLDCNGDIVLNSTAISSLIPFIKQLRLRGINAFLKSSCVTSNILMETNPSEYYSNNSEFCIQCGNCFNR